MPNDRRPSRHRGPRDARRGPRDDRRGPRDDRRGPRDDRRGARDARRPDRGRSQEDRPSGPPRVPNVRRDPARASGPMPPHDWDGPIPQLPKNVRNEIDKLVRSEAAARDILEALAIGASSIDLDATERAIPLLLWAKDRCPRSPTVRETLGVALYLAGEWEQAVSELAAYKRMSGRNDHNHVLADARRATGASLDVYRPLLVEATEDQTLHDDVRVESWLVWAGALADDADVAGSLAVLRQANQQLDRERMGQEPRARLDYLLADLLERAGETDRANGIFNRLADELPGWLDVTERAGR